MRCILLKEMEGRGKPGDVADFAPCFANNYLLPKGIAVPATEGNLEKLGSGQLFALEAPGPQEGGAGPVYPVRITDAYSRVVLVRAPSAEKARRFVLEKNDRGEIDTREFFLGTEVEIDESVGIGKPEFIVPEGCRPW